MYKCCSYLNFVSTNCINEDKYYEYLDSNINNCINADVGFTCLISNALYHFEPEEEKAFFQRYETIKEFQTKSLELFNASLNGEFDPELADLFINELPGGQGLNFHKNFMAGRLDTPVFFRTDEVIPGKISEIQCPGSAWGLYEQTYQFFNEFKSKFKDSSIFANGLARNFAETLIDYLPKEPVLHHLIDNASIPAGMIFFIQKVREQGIKYFGYDKGITPYDCNFIRAHAFAGLLADNHFKFRLEKSRDGKVFYDLPPSIIFDEKIPLILPFWEKTREYFTDAVRDIFPYAQLIRPEGFVLEDGTFVSLEKFINLPRNQRDYYIKYAGSDLALNWGSKGVFYAGSLSKTEGEKLLNMIKKNFTAKKYWIIQKGYSLKENAGFIKRDNIEYKAQVHSKFSGFYGPNGLMGILVMQRDFYKVHGNKDTIISIV